MTNNVFDLPSQPLDLPSKGIFYPSSSPISNGIIELKIPTAKEEDIITNKNLIKQNAAIDKFIESIIISKIDHMDLLIGDKDAIIVAARVLAYGKDYAFDYTDGSKKEEVIVDLTALKNKEIDESLFTKGLNEHEFVLPLSKVTVTYKFLTGRDEKEISDELRSMERLGKNMASEVTTKLKKMIVAVNGDKNRGTINNFVDSMPALDSLKFRRHVENLSPGVDLTVSFTKKDGEVVEGLSLPFTADFFWPR
jgi:hypothetical protein